MSRFSPTGAPFPNNFTLSTNIIANSSINLTKIAVPNITNTTSPSISNIPSPSTTKIPSISLPNVLDTNLTNNHALGNFTDSNLAQNFTNIELPNLANITGTSEVTNNSLLNNPALGTIANLFAGIIANLTINVPPVHIPDIEVKVNAPKLGWVNDDAFKVLMIIGMIMSVSLLCFTAVALGVYVGYYIYNHNPVPVIYRYRNDEENSVKYYHKDERENSKEKEHDEEDGQESSRQQYNKNEQEGYTQCSINSNAPTTTATPVGEREDSRECDDTKVDINSAKSKLQNYADKVKYYFGKGEDHIQEKGDHVEEGGKSASVHDDGL